MYREICQPCSSVLKTGRHAKVIRHEIMNLKDNLKSIYIKQSKGLKHIICSRSVELIYYYYLLLIYYEMRKHMSHNRSVTFINCCTVIFSNLLWSRTVLLLLLAETNCISRCISSVTTGKVFKVLLCFFQLRFVQVHYQCHPNAPNIHT